MYKYESDDSFRAGLATWGYFILIFFFVGLRADLSILLGALAGLAVWMMVRYLKAEALPAPDPKIEAAEAEEKPQPSIFRRVGTRVFDRFRRSRLTDNDQSDVTPADQAKQGSRRGRVIGSKRLPQRYIGKRPPKRIGK
ncbi:MAG: hypothetical protein HC772_03675 [Leptolyngbyaceae cyanobacterium CRU_2_3]|nr:hypothetical protein [Leptolyngbyaceae cyanobacterium CRU_2_3]